jgi:hypothetical protein
VPKPNPDLRDWFTESELAECPRCAERAALPTPKGGYLVCLSCGIVDPEGQRIGDLAAAAARLDEDRE